MYKRQPQDVATLDARKALKMFEKLDIAVLGLVENMAVHVCTNCGHAEHVFGEGGAGRMSTQYAVPVLGSLPLEIGIRAQGDAGPPIVAAHPESCLLYTSRCVSETDLVEVAGLGAEDQAPDRIFRVREERLIVVLLGAGVVHPCLHPVGKPVSQDVVLARGLVDADDVDGVALAELGGCLLYTSRCV